MPARRSPDPAVPRPRRPLTCPICQARVEPEGSASPFCSPRCQRIDLGRWLGGDYRIEVPVEGTDRDVPATDSEGTSS